MEELIRAAFGVISRTRVAVVLVILGLLLPAQLLAAVSPSTAMVGAALGLVAPVVLLVVFLSDLANDRRHSIPAILGALLRVFGAFLIVLLLGFVLIFAIEVVAMTFAVVLANGGAISSFQVDSVRFGIVVASLLAIAAFFAPLLLVLPVCLAEEAGPWQALKRTWALARSRRNLIRVVVVVLVAVTVAIGLIRALGGAVPLAAAVALSIVVLVVDVAILAVLYETLVVDNPPGGSPLAAVPGAVRSREAAAAGTFRESTHQSRKSRRRRR